MMDKIYSNEQIIEVINNASNHCSYIGETSKACLASAMSLYNIQILLKVIENNIRPIIIQKETKKRS